MFGFLSRYWWVLVLRGVLAILFGVFAFASPPQALYVLVLVFGAVAFADGSVSLVAALAGRTLTPHWWIVLVQGLVGIAVGALTFSNPALTAVALLVYIALWAIASGVLLTVEAIKLRHEISGEWLLAAAGVLGIAFGTMLMARPAAGALAFLWLIGAYAIASGLLLTIVGVEVRRLRHRLVG